jgi:hypothetical protein
MFTRPITAGLTLLLAVACARAQQPAPQLLTVFPVGAKAGDTVEVTLAGHGLDGSEKLLFSAGGFSAEPVGPAVGTKAQQGLPTSSVRFKLTVPRNATGIHDVRLVTKTGLSNPRAFVVGDLNDVSEVEPNNDVGQAQKIELDTTVNGVISTPTDVDFVSFKAKAGQTITVSCLTTSIDSRLQADVMVSGPDGKPLASNRGYRGGDAVLDFKAPADGEYMVRVAQFAYTSGGFDHFYRLTVTTRPWVHAVFPPLRNPDGPPVSNWTVAPSAAMVDLIESPVAPGGTPGLAAANKLILDNEKNGTAADAQAVGLPCDIAGRIAKKNERHWYKFDAKKGEVWTLEVFAERIGSPVDAYFVLTDDKGKSITEQDDGADTLTPNQFYTKSDDPGRYRFSVPADGTYRVMVSTREAGVQFGARDQYVLRIAREKPDFRVAVMPFTPHIPDAGTLSKGGTTAFAVFVFRFDGFTDEIELSCGNLPPGVACPPQVVGAGQTRGTLVFVADKDAEDWDGFVQITAKAGDLKHSVRPFTVVWPAVGVQQNQIPNTPMITRADRGPGLALAVRGEAPFLLTPTDTELTAKSGGKVEVTLKVSRDGKFKDPIQVFSAAPNFGPRQQGNQPPQPLGTAMPNSTELKLNIDVPNALPPGTHTLVLRAQSGAPVPKGGNNAPLRAVPTYAALPITVTVTK